MGRVQTVRPLTGIMPVIEAQCASILVPHDHGAEAARRLPDQGTQPSSARIRVRERRGLCLGWRDGSVS
jgi:hypothetical protein